MLSIGKPAEFGSDDLPIRGQCQPHTRGWQLKLFHRGKSDILHTDTYYACRQIQLACIGIPDEAIKDKVEEIVKEMGQDLEETQKMQLADTPADGLPAIGNESTRIVSREELEQEMNKMEGEDGSA